MTAKLSVNFWQIVTTTFGGASVTRKLYCVLSAALSRAAKSAKLNWFHLAIDYKDGTPFPNVFGIGPAVDGWYADVVACNEDSSDETIEQLYIGVWDNHVEGKKPDRIRFYLDLADDVQRHGILVPDRDSLHGWRVVANSFTEWLEQIAATGGTFGYIKP